MSGVSPGGTLPASLARSAIARRPAAPADAAFCCRLHQAAMGDDITATRGWDEQGQRTCHDRAFSPHRWQVITAGPAGTGMVDTGCRPGEICRCAIAGRLASSAVTAKEPGLPRHDRCSLQPAHRRRKWRAGRVYIYVRNGILTHALPALPAIAVEPFLSFG
jgi:hypothetical protein